VIWYAAQYVKEVQVLRKQRGFTLVEIVVVILLISILLGFSVPSLLDVWHQVQADFSIQQLHRDIRWAQREAVKNQYRMQITFYPSDRKYVIRRPGNPVNLRKRELKTNLDQMEASNIIIEKDKRITRNGHVMLRRGGHERYVYFYQTGRTRITKAPAE
jgi:competence protein ComGD